MNVLKSFLLATAILTLSTSCKKEVEKTENTQNTQTKVIAAAKTPAKANLTIEGMTCAIGCAKTIEEDLTNVNGVQKAVVDFDTKIASIDYDASVLTPENLVKKVTSAADGKTYSVTSVK